MELFLNLVKRDIFLAGKTGNKVIISLIFFLLILSIIPLSLGNNLSYINNIAAGIILVNEAGFTTIGISYSSSP